MTPEALNKLLKSKTPLVIIDVRTAMEFRNGHIPGAINLPISKLFFNRKELPQNKKEQLIITCEHGPRAVIAKSLLGVFSYRNCELLDGHMHGYRQKRLPLEN